MVVVLRAERGQHLPLGGADEAERRDGAVLVVALVLIDVDGCIYIRGRCSANRSLEKGMKIRKEINLT